ncbi:lipoprotein [Flavobacterium sp. PL002]|uniref:lipoprotein n=1 Tax=Flavobacterium sp. PL002 TaxID=1897058 RepID=UPI00178893F0|nr:lipoprotein [Flavobacterium sp. PL002]MBE0393889.1 hypothetical protein [Flavobacterium sp. PL002]
MKKITIITAVLVFVLTACQSQSKIDLSDIALDNELNVEKLNLVQQTDLDQITGLPYYSTNEVE